jgi:hypothetical protein
MIGHDELAERRAAEESCEKALQKNMQGCDEVIVT